MVKRAGDLCASTMLEPFLVSGKDCWKAKGEKGWSYKDRAALDGAKKITAVSGALGKGKIQVRAGNKEKKGRKGMAVGIAAALQDEASATVKVRVDDGVCVEATLTDVKKADVLQFKARTT